MSSSSANVGGRLPPAPPVRDVATHLLHFGHINDQDRLIHLQLMNSKYNPVPSSFPNTTTTKTTSSSVEPKYKTVSTSSSSSSSSFFPSKILSLSSGVASSFTHFILPFSSSLDSSTDSSNSFPAVCRYSSSTQFAFWLRVLRCLGLSRRDWLASPRLLRDFMADILHAQIHCSFILPNPGLLCMDFVYNEFADWLPAVLLDCAHSLRPQEGSCDDRDGGRGSTYRFSRARNLRRQTQPAGPRWFPNNWWYWITSSTPPPQEQKWETTPGEENIDEGFYLMDTKLVVYSFLEDVWRDFQLWLRDLPPDSRINLLGEDGCSMGEYMISDVQVSNYLQLAVGTSTVITADHLQSFLHYICNSSALSPSSSPDGLPAHPAQRVAVSVGNDVLSAVKVKLTGDVQVGELDRCVLAEVSADRSLQSRLDSLEKRIEIYTADALRKQKSGDTKGAMWSVQLLQQNKQFRHQIEELRFKLQESLQKRDTATVMSTVLQCMQLNTKVAAANVDERMALEVVEKFQEVQEAVDNIKLTLEPIERSAGIDENELEEEYRRLEMEESIRDGDSLVETLRFAATPPGHPFPQHDRQHKSRTGAPPLYADGRGVIPRRNTVLPESGASCIPVHCVASAVAPSEECKAGQVICLDHSTTGRFHGDNSQRASSPNECTPHTYLRSGSTSRNGLRETNPNRVIYEPSKENPVEKNVAPTTPNVHSNQRSTANSRTPTSEHAIPYSPQEGLHLSSLHRWPERREEESSRGFSGERPTGFPRNNRSSQAHSFSLPTSAGGPRKTGGLMDTSSMKDVDGMNNRIHRASQSNRNTGGVGYKPALGVPATITTIGSSTVVPLEKSSSDGMKCGVERREARGGRTEAKETTEDPILERIRKLRYDK